MHRRRGNAVLQRKQPVVPLLDINSQTSLFLAPKSGNDGGLNYSKGFSGSTNKQQQQPQQQQKQSNMVMSASEQLLANFRNSAEATPFQMNTAATRVQQQQVQQPTSSRAQAESSNVAGRDAQLKQQLSGMKETISNWNQILSEMTQSVVLLCATVVVEQIPYYMEFPDSKNALQSPVGYVYKNQKITLVYPQTLRPNLLFMRLRKCDPNTGEVQMFYMPIANNTLTPQELRDLVKISDPSASQYVDHFHNPGERDPAVSDLVKRESGEEVKEYEEYEEYEN